MKFTYCPECGAHLVSRMIGDEGEVPFCEPCNKPRFSFSYPCVLCLVINEYDEIALIRQSYVSANNYVTVAGYVKQGETLEETVLREIGEEIGLKVIDLKYFKSYYFQRNDNLMFGFICKVKKAIFVLSGEVDEAKWFSLAEAAEMTFPGSIVQNMIMEYVNNPHQKIRT